MKQFFYDEFRNDLENAKDLIAEIFGQFNMWVAFSLVIFVFAISIFNTMGASISYSTGYDSFYSMGNPHSLYFAYADLIKGTFQGITSIVYGVIFSLSAAILVFNLFRKGFYAITVISVLNVALFCMLFNIVAATRVGQNNGGGISSAQGESILIYTFVEDLMSIRRHKGTEYQILFEHFIERISNGKFQFKIENDQAERRISYNSCMNIYSYFAHVKSANNDLAKDNLLQSIQINGHSIDLANDPGCVEGMSGNLFQMQLEPIVRTN